MCNPKRSYKVRVICNQLVPSKDLSHDDREENPSGTHPWRSFWAYTPEHAIKLALDDFHAEVPIACLDDFNIDCEVKREHDLVGVMDFLVNGLEHSSAAEARRHLCQEFQLGYRYAVELVDAGLDFLGKGMSLEAEATLAKEVAQILKQS